MKLYQKVINDCTECPEWTRNGLDLPKCRKTGMYIVFSSNSEYKFAGDCPLEDAAW